MFHVSAGTGPCRHPWQTDILMHNSRFEGPGARSRKIAPMEAGGFGAVRL
jgi:hypothetical protein